MKSWWTITARQKENWLKRKSVSLICRRNCRKKNGHYQSVSFYGRGELFGADTKTLGQMAAKFHVPADFFYREQPMETLSGGEKVKAQMMKLLLTEPTVLLLDEPSNDIDVETLEWLEQFIQNWKHIALFISHDETLIENTANMIIHIEQIRRKTVSRYTIAKMSYEQYRKERLRNFENQERQAESERREKRYARKS